MKKIVALVLAGIFFLSCAHRKEMTEEEKEKFRRSSALYDRGQRSGP
jgi:hypothetical protein